MLKLYSVSLQDRKKELVSISNESSIFRELNRNMELNMVCNIDKHRAFTN